MKKINNNVAMLELNRETFILALSMMMLRVF